MNFLLVAFSLLFLLNSASPCFISNAYGDMFPREAKLLVGSDLIFNCVLNRHQVDNGEIDASNIFFVFFNSTIDQKHVQIIDKYTAQLKIENSSLKDNGRYYCNVKVHESTELVCVSAAYIGLKPIPVNDFKCIYYYRHKLECSWSIPHNRIDTNYTLVESPHGSDDYNLQRLCGKSIIKDNVQKCIWDKSTSPSVHNQLTYYFTLHSNNSFGNSYQDYILSASSIVQTHPPENFEFDKEDNILKWTHPKWIHHDIKLFHLLQYRILLQTNNEDIREINLNNTYNYYALENLKQFTLYNFSIMCKLNDPLNENWSDSIKLYNILTKEGVPSSPPNIIGQAFDTVINSQSRTVTIYWKQLLQDLVNGPDLKYLVTYAKVGNIVDNVWNNLTIYSTNAIFKKLDSSPYEFRIYSYNSIGLSLNYSKLILPSNNDIIEPLRKINVNFYNEGRYEIFWDESHVPFENYTLFWCISKHYQCSGNIDWIYTKETYYNLNLTHDNYMFGVATNTQNSTSGISWTKCVVNFYSQNIEQLSSIVAIKKNWSSILVKWNLFCDAQLALIEEFKIKYCPVESPKETKCTKSEMLIQINGTKDEYLITNLEPLTTYKITVFASNIVKESDPVYETTDFGIPPSPTYLNITNYFENNAFAIKWVLPESLKMVQFFKIKLSDDSKFESIQHSKDSCIDNICLYNMTYSKALSPFTVYTVHVYSCNQKHCSNSSSASFRTLPSAPGIISIPSVESLNSSTLRVYFKRPSPSNGPIDFYYIKFQDRFNNTKISRYDGNLTYADIFVDCNNYSGFQEEAQFLVSIMASNIVHGNELKSNFSESISIQTCKPTYFYFVFIFPVCFVFLLIAVIVFYGVKYFNSIKKKGNEFTIKVQCNDKNNFEIENFVPKEETKGLIDQIKTSKNISTSATNASMISDLSSADNSHSTDKHYLSSSDNFYSPDSGVNELNYRENREYFVSEYDGISSDGSSVVPSSLSSIKPTTLSMAPVKPVRAFTIDSPPVAETVTVAPAPITSNFDLSISSAKSKSTPLKAASNGYVPLSAITNSTDHQYVPHTTFFSPPNQSNTTKV